MLSRRRSHSMPQNEIRLNQDSISKVSWREFSELNRQNLEIYQLVINKILNNFTPTTLDLLRSVLLHEYMYSLPVIERFINFISVNDLEGIEWGESDQPNIRLANLYRSPRTMIRSGAYSAYIPSPKKVVCDRTGNNEIEYEVLGEK
jgi:hypothetical protein